MRNRESGVRRRQEGFSIMEVAIALAISSMAVAAGLYPIKRAMYSNMLTAQGQQMTTINNAVQTYSVKNYKAIVTSSGVAGFANPMQPTIAELKAAKFLSAGFSANGVLGGAYNIRLSCVPTPCVATSDIATVIYMSTPIYRQGTTKPDESAAVEVVLQIGADGALSKAAAPDHFYGPGGVDWGAGANPVNKAAVVAVRGGYGSSVWGQFLRLDGSTPMTGALNMNGNNVTAAATVNATKVVTATGNGVQIGSSNFYGDIANSAIRQNGTLYIQNQAGTAPAALNTGNTAVQGQIDATGSINSNGGSVYAAGEVTAGNWLRTNGDTGWYSNKWGGGWYMSDGTWIRAYNNKSVYTPGAMQADASLTSGYVHSTGDVRADGIAYANYLWPQARPAAGSSCVYGAALNGLISADASGNIMSCVNGVWTTPGGGITSTVNWGQFTGSFYGSNNTGKAMWVSAFGGMASGGSVTSCQLLGSVNGAMVMQSADNAQTYARSCAIGFWVPANYSYAITSAPYNAAAGTFNLVTSQ